MVLDTAYNENSILLLKNNLLMNYNYIGIDVSKDKLNILQKEQVECPEMEILNRISDIETWVSKFTDANSHIIFEHTGTYSSKLAYVLANKQIRFTMVNPSQSSNYSKLKGNTTKNDARDAKLLAEYGEQFQPDVTQLASEQEQELHQALTIMRGLEKSKQLLSNQLHALEQLPIIPKDLETILQKHIDSLNASILDLEKKISFLFKSEPLKEITTLMTSVVGIGKKSAGGILAEVGNPKKFKTAKQFAKFAGITPSLYSSGNTSKKGKIPKRKGSKLRSCLYMAVLSAIQFNHQCKELFERLRRKGKPERIAHWAVAHKLLRQVWGVVTSEQPFVNSLNFAKNNVC